MTVFSILIFALLFTNGLNACVRAEPLRQNPNACVLCEEKTLCRCDQLVLEDDNRKSLKNLLLLLLGRIGATSKESPEESDACHDCRRCHYTCPKKHKVFKVLGDILKKSTDCSRENEEQVLRDIIVKLIDPRLCERHPCETYCDPQVQRVLKAILKKASGCNCAHCPCECILDPPRSNHGEYQYWFRTTKDSIRKEIPYKPVKRERPDEKDAENLDQVHHLCPNKRLPPRTKTCKTCQKPDSLVCPRYVTDDCPATGNEAVFSICADCNNCKMATGSGNAHFPVKIFCEQCKALDSPFVAFTQTGFPIRESTTARNAALRIRTDFLQKNDFRSNETVGQTCSNNPFRVRCNRPSPRKRKKCKTR